MSAPLTQADKQSAVWAKLMVRFKERLDTLRGQNDGPLDEVKTADLRGRIAEIKALMYLNKDSPPM